MIRGHHTHVIEIMRRVCLPFWWGALTVALPLLAFSQSSPADGPWSGSIQCQLDVEQQGYSRHETQTWTLTSPTPTSKNGDMRIYPATWTVTGLGGIQRTQVDRASTAQWNINVPPANASIAMFVRASDGQFIIRIWQRPAPVYNAVQGTRQMAVNNVAQQPAAISSTVHEWMLPWIATNPGANLRGKLSVPTESLGAELTPIGASPTAECTWQFSHSAASAVSEEQSLANAGTQKGYTDSTKQSGKSQQSGTGIAGTAKPADPAGNAGAAAGGKAAGSDANAGGAAKPADTASNAGAGAGGKAAGGAGAIGDANVGGAARPTDTGNAGAGVGGKAAGADASSGGAAKPADATANAGAIAGGKGSGADASGASATRPADTASNAGVAAGGKSAGGDGSSGGAAKPTDATLNAGAIAGGKASGSDASGAGATRPADTVGNAGGAAAGPSTGASATDGKASLTADSPTGSIGNAASCSLTDVANYFAQMKASVQAMYEKLIRQLQADSAAASATAADKKEFAQQIAELQKQEQQALDALTKQEQSSIAELTRQLQANPGAASNAACQALVSVTNANASMLSEINLPQTSTPNPRDTTQSQNPPDGVYVAPANATTTMAPEGTPLGSATVVPFTPAIATPSLAGIAAITPNTATQGANELQVMLTGRFANFEAANTDADFGPGIKVASLKLVSPTNATAILNIDPAAAPGPHTVTLKSGKDTVTLNAGFTVTIAMTVTPLLLTPSMPNITQVSPATAPQETAGLTVTLTGFATHFASGTSKADFGPGITVSRLTIDSPTQATAVLNIDVAAATTTRRVTLTTGTEVVASASGFTVTVPPPAAITSVYPNSVEPGETNVSVTINAQSTHFAQGTTILDFGPGIAVASLQVGSRTTATAVLNIAASAPSSARLVAATTGSEIAKKASYPEFLVTYNPGELIQITPKEGQEAKQLELQIFGRDTHFSQSTTVAMGNYCQFQGKQVSSRGQVKAYISCPKDTSLGPQTVSVTSNGHTIQLYNAFTVTPAPDFYGHSLNSATAVGTLSEGDTRTFSGVLSSQFASDWFRFNFGSGPNLQAVITLKDVRGPSDYILDIFSTTQPYSRRDSAYQPNSSGYKQIILRDDSTHSAYIQVRASRWDPRSAKFTLSLLIFGTPYIDTSPDPFSFSATHMAVPLLDFESNTVTIHGINVDVPIQITEGSADYSINGGAYRSAPGTVREGDRVRLRAHLYPLDVSRNFTVKVGDRSASWLISRLP